VGSNKWIAALLATLVLQTATAYLTRLLPTIAPVLTAQFGWSEASIGYLAGLTMAGSMLFLLGGGPLIRRLGPIRSLQAGLALSGLALAALVEPIWTVAALASIAIGLGYGPSVPAGNDVLQRYAPARHRGLIFSIKQAGVPLGGVIAGLALPALIEGFGWRAALVFSALLVLVSLAAVEPLRHDIDAARDRTQPIGLRRLLSLSNLLQPLRILQESPDLARVGIAGGCFAAGQGAWLAFLVTYAAAKLDCSLAQAGLLFAVMQATGMVGRLIIGFIADRMRSGILAMLVVAVGSALSSFMFAAASATWSFAALTAIVALAGLSVTGWNGVQLSELARLAPPGRVAEASAGGTVLVFVGFVLGPILFAALVAGTGRYEPGYIATGAIAIVALWPLLRTRARYDEHGR
jgi:MFS family permease